MGNKFGIDTALVSTGVKLYANGNSGIKPTYYLNSIYDIIILMSGKNKGKLINLSSSVPTALFSDKSK
jgi:hypothetical protein